MDAAVTTLISSTSSLDASTDDSTDLMLLVERWPSSQLATPVASESAAAPEVVSKVVSVELNAPFGDERRRLERDERARLAVARPRALLEPAPLEQEAQLQTLALLANTTGAASIGAIVGDRSPADVHVVKSSTILNIVMSNLNSNSWFGRDFQLF